MMLLMHSNMNIVNGIVELFRVAQFYLTGNIHIGMTHKQCERLANFFVEHGDVKRALKLLNAAVARSSRKTELTQQLGSLYFIQGEYDISEKLFGLVNYIRSQDRRRYSGDYAQDCIFLDNSWLLAIGHVACISTLIKAKQLSYIPFKKLIIRVDEVNLPFGFELLEYFQGYIEIIRENGDFTNTNNAIFGLDSSLTVHQKDIRRTAISLSFWSGSLERNGKSAARWFAPYFSAVESEWKRRDGPVLFQASENEIMEFRDFMCEAFGLDRDVWFVALHVREPGFHRAWSKYHSSTRDADINSYANVISYINSRGGVVVRMGDPSMKPINSSSGLIDYAHSKYRNEKLDVMLCSQCKYFIGTNSGLSLIPPVFGVKSVLTNWSPIAIPNWYTDDIYIPKLIFDKSLDRYLTFREMYSTKSGWFQFSRNFEYTHWKVEDNSEEDLLEAVKEMHSEVFSESDIYTSAEQERFNKFNDIVLSNGGYIGSRIGRRFLKKYDHLL